MKVEKRLYEMKLKLYTHIIKYTRILCFLEQNIVSGFLDAMVTADSKKYFNFQCTTIETT